MKKDIAISVKLTEAMAKDLEKASNRKDAPESYVIRQALTEYFKKEKLAISSSSNLKTMFFLVDKNEIKISAEMLAMVEKAEIPEARNFIIKILKANNVDEFYGIVFGKTSSGGWECYTRDQDHDGWSMDDALNFRHALILLMLHLDRFKE